MAIWISMLDLIWDYPLLGTGPGTFKTVITQYHPYMDVIHLRAHNDYLQFTSEVGIFVIIIIVWMTRKFYKAGFEKLNSHSTLVYGVTMGAMAGVTAMLVHNMGDFNSLIPANALLFSVLSALVVAPSQAITKKSKKRRSKLLT